MSAILETIRIFIEQIILTLGYPGLAGVIFIENIFTPIPSEIVLPFAGSLASRGQMTLVSVWVWSTIGALLGAVALYYIGVWADEPVFRAFTRRYGKYIAISEKDLDRVMAVFSRYGDAAIGFGRLIPLVRSLISIPAGMNRMPLPRFLLFTTIGSLFWNGLLTTAGFILGENWELILGFADKYEKVWLIVMGLVLAAFIIRQLSRMWNKMLPTEV